jgi:1-deoxy-D-xylulose-5-phosphate synthase
MVIRYPRGEGVMPEWRTEMKEIAIGTGRRLKEGDEIAVLSIGHPGNFQYGINAGHYDMRFVKPLDEAMLHEVFNRYSKIITVEDGTVTGGFGSAVLEFMAANNYHAQVRMLGIPDRIVEHGTLKELHRECSYDANAIAEVLKDMMKEKVSISLHQ